MYYIIVDDDETIVLTDIVNGEQIFCKTLEYNINSSNLGFVLADNKIIFEADNITDTAELDTLFTESYTIQIITENED
jgi:hypothetical protein